MTSKFLLDSCITSLYDINLNCFIRVRHLSTSLNLSPILYLELKLMELISENLGEIQSSEKKTLGLSYGVVNYCVVLRNLRIRGNNGGKME